MRLCGQQITVFARDDRATGAMARKERLAKGISLRQVAKHMKKSAPYISDLERGRRAWNEMLVLKFNAALGRHL